MDISDALSGNQAFPEQEFLLAFLYLNGFGVPKDDRAAFAHCANAAEHGLPCAQYMLGLMHVRGVGTTRNDSRALAWFRKAGDQGHLLAAGSAAYLLESGEGVETDEKEAFQWKLKAATLGSPTHAFMVALSYEEGAGVPTDPAKAFKWYSEAAEMEDPSALRALAEIYEEGRYRVAQDRQRAGQFLARAKEIEHSQRNLKFESYLVRAKHGDRRAQLFLGDVYKNGLLGRPVDEKKAQYWYERGAEVFEEPRTT